MQKLIFWPLASLGLALSLAGCGQDSPPPPTEAPAPSAIAVDNSAPATEATATTSVAPTSRMNVSVYEGSLTISLNGRKVGDYPSPIQLDVTPYLKAGENTIKIDWGANTRGAAKIEYALTATPDKYSDISSFNLTNPEGKQAGSKSLSFNLPNPDGTLPPVETTDTATEEPTPAAETSTSTGDTTSNTATESVVPTETTTPEATTPAPEKATSSGVKAIMSISSNDSPISVSLNGQNVGDFQSYLKIDVGRYLKPGKNTVQIKWTSKTYFNVKIAYFSKDANDYRDVSRTSLYQSDTRKPGSRNISFQIPTS